MADLQAGLSAASILTKLLTVDGAGSGLDADLLDGNSSAYFAVAALVDTEANILATSAGSKQVAYATDTNYLYFSDGSTWRQIPLQIASNAQAPDMGYLKVSARTGYGTAYITDKTLSNVAVGSNADTTNASATLIPMRASSSTLQIYAGGSWQTVVSNFAFRENSTFGYTLEHKPIGFTAYIEPMSGMSLNDLSLSGLPTVQGYSVSMGAYQPPQIIGGRTIS